MTIERHTTEKVCRQCGAVGMERQITIGQGGKLIERLQCPGCKNYSAWSPHDTGRDTSDAEET